MFKAEKQRQGTIDIESSQIYSGTYTYDLS